MRNAFPDFCDPGIELSATYHRAERGGWSALSPDLYGRPGQLTRTSGGEGLTRRMLDATPVLTVAAAAVKDPKTLGPDATVGDAMAAFKDDHVHMLLLVDHGRLLGTVIRKDLDGQPQADHLLRAYSCLHGRTLLPDVPADFARLALVSAGDRRRAIVRPDGTLVGLLCLKASHTGFCSDSDVAARLADRNRPAGRT